jgi:hypothetical protein
MAVPKIDWSLWPDGETGFRTQFRERADAMIAEIIARGIPPDGRPHSDGQAHGAPPAPHEPPGAPRGPGGPQGR